MKRLIIITSLIFTSLLFGYLVTRSLSDDGASPGIVDLGEYAFKDYDSQSHAFNIGGSDIRLYLAALAQQNNVSTAVETGTWKGYTSVFLSQIFERVFTIELSLQSFLEASHNCHPYPNIHCLLGHSADTLHNLLPSLADQPILFYLDAHWNSDWPLLRELEEISFSHRDNCIIVIDDFKVPSMPEIKYDAYDGKECSFNYIKKKLAQVFTDCVCFYLIPKQRTAKAKFVAYPKSWVATEQSPASSV